jgi:GNAT superfamily N-acetyltransferase
MLNDDRCAVLLARTGGRALAVATVSSGVSLEYGYYAEIDDLYVLPSQRGQGLGRQLVEAALDWCRARGCALVLVTVTSEGEAAHRLSRFYDKLGFVDTQRTLMALSLSEQSPT